MRKPALHHLPPLSFAVLEQIERLRSSAQQSLDNCHILGTSYLDHDRAAEIMCACAIEEARIRLEFYRTLPTFREEWKIEITEVAVLSIMGCFPNLKFEIRYLELAVPGEARAIYENPKQFTEEMIGAVDDYLSPPWERAKYLLPATLPDPEGKTNRKEMAERYLSELPGTMILDICWAAGQHYSEWKRWLRNALKNGSTPDRAFRALLQSGKTPQEYKKQPRPHGWK